VLCRKKNIFNNSFGSLQDALVIKMNNDAPAPFSVIFDLDGTLADTSGDLIAAANRCFADRGHKNVLDPIADQATAFAGGRAMLRLGHQRINTDRIAKAVEADFPDFLKAYEEHIDVYTTLYENVTPTLDRLAGQGFRLGVCTNKPVGLAHILLKKLAIADRFAAVLGADSLAVRKPDPAHLLETIRQVGGVPEKSVLIGDTLTDRAAAKNANVPCVLVTFGPTGRDVAKLKPQALLDHYDDLFALLAKLLPL